MVYMENDVIGVKRGRKAIDVSKAELQTAIILLEKEKSFSNRSALWSALEATDWAKSRSPRPLTAQVAMMLSRKYGTVIDTPVGKRGREKGCAPISKPGVKRKKAMSVEVKDILLHAMPPSLHNLVERAAGGHLRSAVKLKCIDCSGGCKKEVSLCQIKDCPLWHFRPFQNKKKKVEGEAHE